MDKIPLREYLQEIEEYIKNDNPEDAIEHCLHILNMFPKALMGK